jgi:hypothetical protein
VISDPVGGVGVEKVGEAKKEFGFSLFLSVKHIHS